MLHLTLAPNLLNAGSGLPRLDIRQVLPGYPRPLPHSDRSFQIFLFRFGPEAIEAFSKIEQPSRTSGPPEDNNYETIGQFYQAIERGFRELSRTLNDANVFCGDPARQITDQHFYSGGSGGGRIIAIDSLATALVALEEIVEHPLGAHLGCFRIADNPWVDWSLLSGKGHPVALLGCFPCLRRTSHFCSPTVLTVLTASSPDD